MEETTEAVTYGRAAALIFRSFPYISKYLRTGINVDYTGLTATLEDERL